MASSDTLSIFVPAAGTTITQTTTSGAKVTTSKFGDTLNTRVFPNDGKMIDDVGIKEPTTGKTRTTFGGPSKDTSYIGNADKNTVTYTGDAYSATIKTGGGDDKVVGNDFTNSTISLGGGDNSATTGGLFKTTLTSGSGADSYTILGNSKDVKISSGSGDDSLIFGGKVNDGTILLGKGADYLDFSAKVTNTWIDLGNDSNVDEVVFNSKADIGKGTAIFGSGENDLLIIGGEEYKFSEAKDAFISSIHPNDSIQFG